MRNVTDTQDPLVLQWSFRDVDDLCETTREWDLEFRQLRAGAFRGDVLQAQDGPLSFGFARFQGHLEQRGAPPAGTWTFAIPTRQCRPFVWHRESAGPGDLLVFRPEMELDAVSPHEFQTFTFSVPEEILDRLAEARGLPGIRTLCRDGGVVRMPADAGRRVERSLTGAQRILAEGPGFGGAGSPHRLLGEEIPGRLLAALRVAMPRATMVSFSANRSGIDMGAWPGRVRDRAMARAESLIEARGWEALTVADLCDATGASARTLRRAFAERYGVAPKAYLQAYRLNAVHKELLRARPSRTHVADAANQWGFWHMGQFAADYRRMFGELPSQTLRRRPPT